jgi:hypothetical protein
MAAPIRHDDALALISALVTAGVIDLLSNFITIKKRNPFSAR